MAGCNGCWEHVALSGKVLEWQGKKVPKVTGSTQKRNSSFAKAVGTIGIMAEGENAQHDERSSE